MIRVAAVADVHFGTESHGQLRPGLNHLADRADLLLIGGDLTRCGGPAEAQVLADELRGLPVPTVAVLGNHDYHADRQDEVRARLEAAGVQVLEGEALTLELHGVRVGIAGAKGFGGGFRGACGSDFGEPEMKAFIGHTKRIAERLGRALDALDADFRIALLHYSPIEATLVGERLEIYPFLGSYLLAEAIDTAGADLVLHGHAHRGVEKGETPAGIPVRNVAQPVIGHAYNVYTLDGRHRRAPLAGIREPAQRLR
ncbi:MAG: metallophosphoesterase [Candidatus Dormibacteraeota bacterium]|nr:metallophosphoesterase [Candidatus Dormibacteraeota bacterium]